MRLPTCSPNMRRPHGPIQGRCVLVTREAPDQGGLLLVFAGDERQTGGVAAVGTARGAEQSAERQSLRVGAALRLTSQLLLHGGLSSGFQHADLDGEIS
jgi:hypothetical protein